MLASGSSVPVSRLESMALRKRERGERTGFVKLFSWDVLANNDNSKEGGGERNDYDSPAIDAQHSELRHPRQRRQVAGQLVAIEVAGSLRSWWLEGRPRQNKHKLKRTTSINDSSNEWAERLVDRTRRIVVSVCVNTLTASTTGAGA